MILRFPANISHGFLPVSRKLASRCLCIQYIMGIIIRDYFFIPRKMSKNLYASQRCTMRRQKKMKLKLSTRNAYHM